MKALILRTAVQTLELLKNNVFQCLFICALSTFLAACSITATRPLQEMSNADAAFRAARDVNADTVVPDLYRDASEAFFKAKREYRLKNFDVARTWAIRATRLAEKAEFEAYRLGGAAPEAGNTPIEGALPDSETRFSSGHDSVDEVPKAKAKVQQVKKEPEPKDQGMDYNEYLRQQEAEKAQAEAEKAKAESEKEKPQEKPKKKSDGAELALKPRFLLAQADVFPRTGSVPQPTPSPISLGESKPPQEPTPQEKEALKKKLIDEEPTLIDRIDEPASPPLFSPIGEMKSEPIKLMGADSLPEVGQRKAPMLDGFQPLSEELPQLRDKDDEKKEKTK